MTREELREYVEELESQGEIPYYVYSNLIDCIDTLEQEPTTKNDLEDFARWVAKEIINEEMWEYNHQSFTELACRKLVKLGIMQERNGEYLYEVLKGEK